MQLIVNLEGSNSSRDLVNHWLFSVGQIIALFCASFVKERK